jgi:hypothetical protein
MDDSNEESIEVRQQIVITHIVHEGSQDSDQELSCDSNQERVEIQIKNLETGGIKFVSEDTIAPIISFPKFSSSKLY